MAVGDPDEGDGEAVGDAIDPPRFIRESGLLEAALETASRAHLGQVRYDGAPYLSHPLRVCELLAQAGADEPTLAAALLHDGIEDSELSLGTVVERFGVEIGELVGALTEDELIDDWVERKDHLRAQVEKAGARAASIYAADKLANLQEMRILYARRGEEAIHLHKAPTLDLRVAAWRADLEMVRRVACAEELVDAFARALELFEADRRNTGARSAQRV